MEWLSATENETCALMSQLIFNYALAIFVQKQGVRCNDVAMIKAGHNKFMPMFYGFNHPIYQELEYYDLANKVQYPKEIAALLDQNATFTANLEYNHQGGDFSLENKIKRHKMVAPKGNVTNDMWKRVTRSIDSIENICKTTNRNLGFSEDDHYKDVNLHEEIVHWRAVLRKSEIISSQDSVGFITNIYKEPLNSKLESLTEVLTEKMHSTWQSGSQLRTTVFPSIDGFTVDRGNSIKKNSIYPSFNGEKNIK